MDALAENKGAFHQPRRRGVIKSGCGPGDWKVTLTRRLESLRYVVPTFLSAGSGDIPVPGSMLRLTHF